MNKMIIFIKKNNLLCLLFFSLSLAFVSCSNEGKSVNLFHLQKEKSLSAKDVILSGMLEIEGGTFTLGYNGITDQTKTVTLTTTYTISKVEVTYELWKEVRDWAIKNNYTISSEGKPGSDGTGTPRHPVTEISWDDAVVWCNAYSEKEDLEPCYYKSSEHKLIYKNSLNAIALQNDYVKWDANGIRLPTEAEWEFAATNRGQRAGNEYSGCVVADLEEYGLYTDNSISETKPVASFKPNELSLYDMTGNVIEWCWDYKKKYSSGEEKDPKGPDLGTGLGRSARGGYYESENTECRNSDRDEFDSSNFDTYIGFRFVRVLQDID